MGLNCCRVCCHFAGSNGSNLRNRLRDVDRSLAELAPAAHVALVVRFIEPLGFAPINLGKLSEGGRLQQFGGALAIKNFSLHPSQSH